MASTAATPADTHIVDPKRDRLVITASALGTVFEWYDFFLYGILAALLGRLFFPADNPTAATLASASPRKPIVRMENRSLMSRILEVA